MPKKTGLGRGYEALMSDNTIEDAAVVEVKIDEVEPNPDQPRKMFDPEGLRELSENIQQHGLLQPILVRPMPLGGYQIVAGERRWRACMQAGFSTISVVVKEFDDKQTAEAALVENLQREDLNAVELAKGLRQLMDSFGLTQEQVAHRVGKSRSAVSNYLRLFDLEDYFPLIEDGTISMGHAKAMLSLGEELRGTAVHLIKSGANVREIERMRKTAKPDGEQSKRTAAAMRPMYYSEVEIALKSELGRKVEVKSDKNKGALCIEFYDADDLKRLIKEIFG